MRDGVSLTTKGTKGTKENRRGGILLPENDALRCSFEKPAPAK
jgi:hypothetical protein